MGRFPYVHTGINNVSALKDIGCNYIDCFRVDVSNYGRLVYDARQLKYDIFPIGMGGDWSRREHCSWKKVPGTEHGHHKRGSGIWCQGCTTHGWCRGSDGIRDYVHVNMWKTWVDGDVRWVLLPKSIINIICDCYRRNRRLIRRISRMVMDKCRDMIDVGINSIHKVIF